MNYAICENEKISNGLEQFANWMEEKDEHIPPDIYKRLMKVSNKIIECAHEFNGIIEDYYNEEN